MKHFLWGVLKYVITRVGTIIILGSLAVHFLIGFGAVADAVIPESGFQTHSGDANTLVVGVAQPDGGKNITPVARRTVEYWEANDGRYDAAFEAEYVFKPNASSPDILIQFTSSTSCDGYAGCAPITGSEGAIRDMGTAVIQIDRDEVPNERMGYMILRHEFGHVISVNHCEEPRRLMGCPYPNQGEEEGVWHDKKYPFLDSSLTVYVASPSSDMESAGQQAVDNLNAGKVEGVPDDLQLTRVEDPWKADVVVTISECGDCNYAYDYQLGGGQPYGNDDNLEYLGYAEISIRAESPEKARQVVQSTIAHVTTGKEPDL